MIIVQKLNVWAVSNTTFYEKSRVKRQAQVNVSQCSNSPDIRHQTNLSLGRNITFVLTGYSYSQDSWQFRDSYSKEWYLMIVLEFTQFPILDFGPLCDSNRIWLDGKLVNYFATVSSERFVKNEKLIMSFQLNLIKWQIRFESLCNYFIWKVQ